MVDISNLGTILIAIVLGASVVLIVLIVIEKKLYRKVLRVKNTKNRIYIEKISKLDISDPNKTLKGLDKLARNFFSEAFKTKTSAEYSELKEIFKKKNNKIAIEFCDAIESLLYSGKKTDKKQNKKLIMLLLDIIEKNKIITKIEKKELDKKSQKKDKELKIEEKIKKVKGFFSKKPSRNIQVPSVAKKKPNNKKNNSKNN